MTTSKILIINLKECVSSINEQLGMFLEPYVSGNVYWGSNIKPILEAGKKYFTPQGFEIGKPIKFSDTASLIHVTDILDEEGTVVIPKAVAVMLSNYGTFTPVYHPKTIELILAYIDYIINEYVEYPTQRNLKFLNYFRYIDDNGQYIQKVTGMEDNKFASYCERMLSKAFNHTTNIRDFIATAPWCEYSVKQDNNDPYRVYITQEEDFRITWYNKCHSPQVDQDI